VVLDPMADESRGATILRPFQPFQPFQIHGLGSKHHPFSCCNCSPIATSLSAPAKTPAQACLIFRHSFGGQGQGCSKVSLRVPLDSSLINSGQPSESTDFEFIRLTSPARKLVRNRISPRPQTILTGVSYPIDAFRRPEPNSRFQSRADK
jgi:hypothetical protein